MQTEDLILISVDDHVVEPPSLGEFLSEHVPAKYKDRAPRVIRRDDGTDAWLIEGKEIATLRPQRGAGPAAARTGARDPASFDQVRPGLLRRARAHPRHERQRRARLAQLPVVARHRRPVLRCRTTTHEFVGRHDRAPTTTGTSTSGAAPTRAASSRWALGLHARRRLDGRRDPPPRRRRAATRCRATPTPTASAAPDYPRRRVGPGVAGRRGHRERHGVPLRRHAQLHAALAVRRDPARRCRSRPSIFASELLWSPILRKFPRLKLALAEGGIGWVPVLPREGRLRLRPPPRGGPAPDFGDKLPSQVFREHVQTCFIDDETGLRNRALHRRRHDHVGVRLPALRLDVAAVARGPDEVARRPPSCPTTTSHKVTWENACRWYQFDPFEHRTPRGVHGGGAAGAGRRRRHHAAGVRGSSTRTASSTTRPSSCAARPLQSGATTTTSSRRPMERFQDRRIIVTGGASGIGRATVLRLLAEAGTVHAVDVVADGLAETRRAGRGRRRRQGSHDRHARRVRRSRGRSRGGRRRRAARRTRRARERGGHPARRAHPRVHARDVEPGHRREPHRHVPHDPRRAPGDARSGRRRHRELQLHVGVVRPSRTWRRTRRARVGSTRSRTPSRSNTASAASARSRSRPAASRAGSPRPRRDAPADADWSLFDKMSPVVAEGFAPADVVASMIAALASDDGRFVSGTSLRIDGGAHG